MAKTKSLDEQLYDACRRGRLATVKELIAAGAPVNGRFDYGGAKQQTPMHGAAASGNLELIAYLLEQGGELDAVDARGKPPLWATLGGSYGMSDVGDLQKRLLVFKQLIARGAKPLVVDAKGGTLLHFVAELEVPEQDDEDADAEEDPEDEDVIAAAEHLHGFDRHHADAAVWWAVDYFVSLGLAVDAKDANDETPLHRAMGGNNGPVTKALLALGAPVDARDKHGATALHHASQIATAAPLCDAKADVAAVDERGNTPLHHRAGYHVDVAVMLIANGAPLDAKNADGKTPFDMLDGEDREWEMLLAGPGVVSKRADLYALDDQLAADPDNASLLVARGDVNFRLAMNTNAVADYRRAVELGGGNANVLFRMGAALSNLQEHADAAAAFDQALALAPDHIEARWGRAQVALELHDYERTIADAEALRGRDLNAQRVEMLDQLIARARAKQAIAAMSAVEQTELWYGVTLPAEYRAFLADKVYEQYPAHRPARLPSYNPAPRVAFIYGDSVFGLEHGAHRFDPEGAEELAKTFALESEAGITRRAGDYLKQEVFSGMEFPNYDDGALDTLLPFAVLGNGDDSQALAIDIGKPGCAIVMYEHETGEFEPVSDTLAEFLAGMKPVGAGGDDADDEDEDEEEDGEGGDGEGGGDEEADGED